MPVSQSLKFFKQLLKEQLKNHGESIKKIKLKDKGSFISVSIKSDHKTTKFNIDKINVVEIIKNTKEKSSLNYLVKNIEWRVLPLWYILSNFHGYL